MHNRQGMPYEPTPSTEPIFGEVQDSYDIVNKYGTYNIQPTTDTGNVFPMIAPGLPREFRDMRLTKEDAEKGVMPSAPASSKEKSDASLHRPPAQ